MPALLQLLIHEGQGQQCQRDGDGRRDVCATEKPTQVAGTGVARQPSRLLQRIGEECGQWLVVLLIHA